MSLQIFALDVRPDVIFFLTDGIFNDITLEELGALNARGKRVVPHGYKTNITLAANLAFLSPRDEPAEYSTSRSPLRWRLTKESFDIGGDGRVAVPDAPGLGVTLDPAVVAEFRKA